MSAPTSPTTGDSAAVQAPSESVLRALPKVSLHDHLDGAVRPQTIIDLSPVVGLDLPTADADELGAWFLGQSTTGSLVDYLRSFDITTAVMRDAAGLERVAREYVLDVAADGVVHGVVRWAPEQSAADGLSLDGAVEAVLAGLEAGAAQVRAAGGSTTVTLLVCAMRQNDRSEEIAELALRHREAGVVGFDIAGPEKAFPPSAHRAAFERVAAAHLPITVHAGEADDLPSIASALLEGRALRPGHGTRLALDITEVDGRPVLGPLATWVRDRGIALELSLTSNLHTGAFAHWGERMTEHPFDLLYRSGTTVTVNTDNRLMSATTLTADLAALVDAFGYGLADLEKLQLNAAHATFLPAPARADLAERIRAGFAAARDSASSSQS
ncbi:adenosine deaminase [uncultured Pseudokineococcus sp.]|uniref:adenosine deaminase n=1 Tax=uncultured Pseudokineococcus sp. TaxID=1642928 RepID=UPI00261A6C7B|nr:adenosine deaminase [uncultured Pseudokineococcus sp.]